MRGRDTPAGAREARQVAARQARTSLLALFPGQHRRWVVVVVDSRDRDARLA